MRLASGGVMGCFCSVDMLDLLASRDAPGLSEWRRRTRNMWRSHLAAHQVRWRLALGKPDVDSGMEEKAAEHPPHAGATGFSDEEMKKLMIESSAKLADVLVARDAAPELYTQFLLAYGAAYSSGWDRRADAYVLVNEHVGSCPACGEPVRIEWAFCASCGGRLAVAA